MNFRPYILHFALATLLCSSCSMEKSPPPKVQAYETAADGAKLARVKPLEEKTTSSLEITIDTSQKFQTITGFGGAFTEASAHLLNQVKPAVRERILSAYFSDSGAAYSLTRTHMNSCDFSLHHYSYAPEADDTALTKFSVKEDTADIIPMIKDAQRLSANGFKIIASPWTAPPWMKTNNDWYGGKLKPEYYNTWAKFFVKYVDAYQKEGIPIWGFTVENEPLGNDASWESMHYTPEEMASFVKNHLGPTLKSAYPEIKILVYDQNRGEELDEWASVLLQDTALLPYIYGTAVHWYTGTVDWFPESLQYTHQLAPQKAIIHTEGCVDAQVPQWQNDAWYWQKKATDWGYQWAKPENKKDHPKYRPTYRYARDIIGTLNNHVEGWIDWNMVLNTQGGPNLAENWCVAPVIVKEESSEVYFTPLYYVMSHFSKFIRPGARRVKHRSTDEQLMVTAALHPNGSLTAVIFNPAQEAKTFTLKTPYGHTHLNIKAQAIQTVILN
mgnify:CR=1 FL=1